MITEESQGKIRELRESGKFCCIKILSDYSYWWDVQLIISEVYKVDGVEVNPYHALTISTHNEDLNKAIDEAYKKANI